MSTSLTVGNQFLSQANKANFQTNKNMPIQHNISRYKKAA